MKSDRHQWGFTQSRGKAAGYSILVAVCSLVISLTPFSNDAFAQDGLVELEIEQPEDVGLAGLVRPGTWAPMRVMVKNNTPQVMNLHLEWIMPDVDGDEAIHQRTPVPLGPNRTTARWLYAVPTVGGDPDSGWMVRCVDAESGDTLALKRIAPKKVLRSRTGVIGITGGGLVGLGPYRDPVMQHEQLEFITNVIPSKLPDQWHGLSLLDTLVWTPDGGDPNDPAVAAGLNAVREWVWRGGHLIISLSSVDVGWSDKDSKAADLLPPVTIRQAEVPTPQWLYPQDKSHLYGNTTFSAKTFEPREDTDGSRKATILQPDPRRPSEPLIAVSSYGFGRVTLIGFDLTDPRFATNTHFIRYGLPSLWKTIKGFQNPAYLPVGLPPYKQLVKDGRVVSEISRDYRELSKFIPGQVAMKQTAATTLFAAVLLFAVYWLVAGPVMYGTLKARGMLRHSWLVFGAIVIAFSAVSWLGAMLLRPGRVNTTHFSVVDIDATQSRAGLIRTQSWFSVFVPRHGTASIELDNGREGSGQNILSSPGLPGSDKGSFTGVQNYVVNAIAPEKIDEVPMRSTAKQFQAVYADTIAGSSMEKVWEPPTGDLKLIDVPFRLRKNGIKLPSGQLTHSLPRSITNITVIFCPGSDDEFPGFSWNKQMDWEPGKAYTIDATTFRPLIETPRNALLARRRNAGVSDPKKIVTGYENRKLGTQEGLLGGILGRSAKSEYEAIVALSFFNYLPPPDFVENPQSNTLMASAKTPTHMIRAVGRSLDLSHMVPMRRLIIIGHMKTDAPIPLPLKVDGDEVNSEGWTVVRFILPIDEPEQE